MSLTKPTWYSEPQMIAIPVDPERVKRSPLGHEVVVSVEIDGDRRSAVVPTEAYDERKGTVVANKVGEMGGSVLVSFPSGSTGTATWAIPKSLLNNLLA